MEKILKKILELLARAYLRRYKPKIIAVTGNVGKSSTKNAIQAVLMAKFYLRASAGNLNNELGVPMTILGDYAQQYYTHGSSFGLWLRIISRGIFGLIIKHSYPEVLVLEYGADRPGDIQRLAVKYPPQIAVMTGIGETPVHIEFFKSAKELANEKSHLIRALTAGGVAILDADDPVVLEMQTKTQGKVLRYGFHPEAQVFITNYAIRLDEAERPSGVSYKLNYDGSFVPVKLAGVLGQAHATATAAGAAVGVAMGMHLVDISTALEKYDAPPGRMRIISGLNNTIIIDDSYNSSPLATASALETIKHIPDRRKIAVLGDMLELGSYAEKAHRDIGALAGNTIDLLVCVGDKAKFIAEAAAEFLSQDRIFQFDDSQSAIAKVESVLASGDLVLVKGSQGMRMERIVKAIMADPSHAPVLLCRQSRKWLAK